MLLIKIFILFELLLQEYAELGPEKPNGSIDEGFDYVVKAYSQFNETWNELIKEECINKLKY